MSKGYRGRQSRLRPSIIKAVDGYLGSFHQTLNLGDTQIKVFGSKDDGPFWMMPTEREMRQKAVITNKTVKIKYTKEELILKLKEKGVSGTENMKHIQRLCQNMEIPLVELVEKTQLGWEGQPKGMLQFLWEHGWIDINNLGNYTASGKRNELVFIYTEFSLKYLLGSCQVIEEEESLLQAQGTSLGVTVDQTQKCHHELAGEGIQYSWGCAENYY